MVKMQDLCKVVVINNEKRFIRRRVKITVVFILEKIANLQQNELFFQKINQTAGGT